MSMTGLELKCFEELVRENEQLKREIEELKQKLAEKK